MTRRAVSTLLWVLVAAALAFPANSAAPGSSDEETLWAEVRLNSQAIGFYHESTQRGDDQVVTTVDLEFALGRLGSRVEIKSKVTYVQTADGHLRALHAETSASKTSTTTDVVVSGQTLRISATSGGKSYEHESAFSGQLMGPEGARQLLVHHLNCPEKTFSYQTFVPELGAVRTITSTCLGREMIEAQGKSVTALRVDQTMEGNPIAQTLWADDSGHLVRLEQPTPFGAMATVRVEREPALAAAPSTELPKETYERTLVISNVRIPHPRRVQEMTIRITHKKPELGWPEFASPEQTVLEKTTDHVVLRITQPPSPPATATTGPLPADLQRYLAANALLQSDDDRVKQAAAEAISSQTDALASALALQRWTARNMHFDLGIAMVPASEVVTDRHGTCIGYSILLASLARAAHIPSRIRMGYVYDGNIWGGHAWTELYVNGRWLPLDAAEYFPGASDAARLSMIVSPVDNGVIDNVGDLSKLYGNVEIAILDFTIGGKKVIVPGNAPAFRTDSNKYVNRWLGLQVTKPSAMKFFATDSHWPDDTVVGIQGGGDSLKVNYDTASPDVDWRLEARRVLAGQGLTGEPQPTRWQGMPAMRISGGEKAGLALVDGEVVWSVVASGPHADRLLATVSNDIRLTGASALHPGRGSQAPRLSVHSGTQ